MVPILISKSVHQMDMTYKHDNHSFPDRVVLYVDVVIQFDKFIFSFTSHDGTHKEDREYINEAIKLMREASR